MNNVPFREGPETGAPLPAGVEGFAIPARPDRPRPASPAAPAQAGQLIAMTLAYVHAAHDPAPESDEAYLAGARACERRPCAYVNALAATLGQAVGGAR